jgi:hypothetical protein
MLTGSVVWLSLSCGVTHASSSALSIHIFSITDVQLPLELKLVCDGV